MLLVAKRIDSIVEHIFNNLFLLTVSNIYIIALHSLLSQSL
jgi:hypothetical protein